MKHFKTDYLGPGVHIRTVAVIFFNHGVACSLAMSVSQVSPVSAVSGLTILADPKILPKLIKCSNREISSILIKYGQTDIFFK